MCEKNKELIVFSVKMHVIFRQLFVYRKRPLVQWSVWYCQDWSNYDHGTWNQGWGQQVWYGGKLIIGIERSFKNSKKKYNIFEESFFVSKSTVFWTFFIDWSWIWIFGVFWGKIIVLFFPIFRGKSIVLFFSIF